MVSDAEFFQLRSKVYELEAQLNFLYKHLGVSYVPDTSSEDARDAKIIELLKKGDMIGAIKAHREAYGSDLVSAKNAVEALRSRTGY